VSFALIPGMPPWRVRATPHVFPEHYALKL